MSANRVVNRVHIDVSESFGWNNQNHFADLRSSSIFLAHDDMVYQRQIYCLHNFYKRPDYRKQDPSKLNI